MSNGNELVKRFALRLLFASAQTVTRDSELLDSVLSTHDSALTTQFRVWFASFRGWSSYPGKRNDPRDFTNTHEQLRAVLKGES